MFAGVVACVATLALGSFVASELLTDTVAGLQFLWWVPRLWFIVGGVVLCVLGVALRRTSTIAWWSLIAALLLLARGAYLDWGCPKPRPIGSFRLVHWNASAPSPSAVRFAVDALLSTEADAIVLTDPGAALRAEHAQRFVDAGFEIVHAGRFALLSRTKAVEARPILAQRGRHASKFAMIALDRTIVIEAIDLPSDVELARGSIVEALASQLVLLRSTPPDVAIGDFNIPRRSASLALLYPGFRDSFQSSGVGWGMSFPRAFPILHIDLTLVGPQWEALRSELIDAGCGRHLLQVVDLAPITKDPN